MVESTHVLLTDVARRRSMSETARERALGFTWHATATTVERVIAELGDQSP